MHCTPDEYRRLLLEASPVLAIRALKIASEACVRTSPRLRQIQYSAGHVAWFRRHATQSQVWLHQQGDYGHAVVGRLPRPIVLNKLDLAFLTEAYPSVWADTLQTEDVCCDLALEVEGRPLHVVETGSLVPVANSGRVLCRILICDVPFSLGECTVLYCRMYKTMYCLPGVSRDLVSWHFPEACTPVSTDLESIAQPGHASAVREVSHVYQLQALPALFESLAEAFVVADRVLHILVLPCSRSVCARILGDDDSDLESYMCDNDLDTYVSKPLNATVSGTVHLYRRSDCAWYAEPFPLWCENPS